eukprot:SRR837773.10137.p1 GENE.SRR837773.10137~~SRR837773.10137.p1  ORF type:complete len:260 (+),score=16.70 SRR837773.10137:37-816(+)
MRGLQHGFCVSAVIGVAVVLQGCGSRRRSTEGASDNTRSSSEDDFDPETAEPMVSGKHYPMCRTWSKGFKKKYQVHNFQFGEYTAKGKEPECDIDQTAWAKLRCDMVDGQTVENMHTWCYKDNPKIGCCCQWDGVDRGVRRYFKKVNEVRECSDVPFRIIESQLMTKVSEELNSTNLAQLEKPRSDETGGAFEAGAAVSGSPSSPASRLPAAQAAHLAEISATIVAMPTGSKSTASEVPVSPRSLWRSFCGRSCVGGCR